MSTGLASRPRTDAPARIAAVDLARLVAVVGMMASHLLPAMTGFPGEVATAATHGFPSTLFGVVAGVTTVVAAERPRRDGRLDAAVGAQLARGSTVALVGVALVLVPTFVAVVLVPLGVAIVAAAPLQRAGSAVLGAIAAGLAVGGPLLTSMLDAHRPLSGLGPVQRTLDGLLFIGAYPVITWLVYVVTGMLIGRALLAAIEHGREAVIAVRLVAGGAAAIAIAGLVDAWYVLRIAAPARADGDDDAIPEIVQSLRESGYGTPHGAGWDAILIAAPHTGTTLDLIRTGGGAALVLGAMVLLAGGGAPRSLVGRVLAAAGGAAFTMYVLHILTTGLLLSLADAGIIEWGGWDVPALLVDLAILLALGAVLAATGRRGPFEALTRAAGRLGARVASRRAR